MKFIVTVMFCVGMTFAGNFQKSSDTLKTDYYPVYYTQPVYHPKGTVYKRTAPYECLNPNCRKPAYPYQKRERRVYKVYRQKTQK